MKSWTGPWEGGYMNGALNCDIRGCMSWSSTRSVVLVLSISSQQNFMYGFETHTFGI